MAHLPKQKTIDNPRQLGGVGMLYNGIVPFDMPKFTDGALWRYMASRQPVIQDCIISLIMYAQSLPWDVRAVQPDENDDLKDEIIYYKKIFKDAGGAKHMNHTSLLLQDYYEVPFGGAAEAVRYTNGKLFKIVNIDATTLFPTQNPVLPIMQKVGTFDPVYYKPDEIVRVYQFPRPEIERKGWGMTPLEKVYLAVEVLARGDKYYAQLLLDTPEAGLLDLGDMSKESAEKWLDSFKNMMNGIDAFKIPVLYQHTVAAKFIPFGRPPTELMFDSITFKYASLVCAAFGITTGDIGLKHAGGGASLSGQMRDERHSKSTGYASLKAYLKEYYDSFLPDELEYVFIDTDDENLVARGRARSTNAVAGRNLIESGAITPDEWRAQLKADGLMTIPLKEAPDDTQFDILKEIDGTADANKIAEEQLKLQKQQIAQAAKNPTATASKAKPGAKSLNKQRNVRGGKLEQVQGKPTVPASQGGQGEIKSELVELAYIDSRNELEKYLDDAFAEIRDNSSETRLRKLIKSAIKQNYTTVKSAINEHGENYQEWKAEYLKMVFDQSDNEVLRSIVFDHLSTFSDLTQNDKWWEIDFDHERLSEILGQFYKSGLEHAANQIQIALYEDGLVDRPDVNKSFMLKDEKTLHELDAYAIALGLLINSGTDYFVKRLSLGSIAEVADIPEFKSLIQDGITLDSLLNNDSFVNTAANILSTNFDNLLDTRIKSIADVENQKIYNRGILKQYSQVGITRKALQHVGGDEACDVCKENEALGFVDLSYKYTTKFGEDTETPPLHPNCHHILTFSKSGLRDISHSYWNGE